jgi:hypothetical protein
MEGGQLFRSEFGFTHTCNATTTAGKKTNAKKQEEKEFDPAVKHEGKDTSSEKKRGHDIIFL